MKYYIIILSIFLFISCERKYDDSEIGIKYQRIIDECERIEGSIPHVKIIPEGDSTHKPENAFDPNIYFSILKNIKMQDDYVLDYVILKYKFHLDGFPVVYARRSNEKPFNTHSEYENKIKELFNIKNEYIFLEEFKYPYNFMRYIELNKSEHSFFEYAVLNIFLNQFYISGHANYNDWKIICTKEKLNKVLQSTENLPDSIRNHKLYKSVEPIITDKGENAEVSFCVFTKWGGLLRKKYLIKKTKPHILIDINDSENGMENPDTLIKYVTPMRF